MDLTELDAIDYSPDSPVNELVLDAAAASGRSKDKALEWIHRLHQQDVLMVRDLRALHPEDWANLGLTVFATRTLKNFMSGTRPSVTTSGNEIDLDSPSGSFV